ncbi:SDR family oxidoreductase [Tabrizicola sp. J26]|uniref:SDR family oxidoreductase n=1 Tax=Alitabrizicola rongguiensis TaxID=2909234 RepID=UPI001F3206BF|nr:SDR family oxidoreductase [Tabrizicola rongguiensis]MCF1707930.1 SDR family oxidoreductase [Tabrizicola rongguiensis]
MQVAGEIVVVTGAASGIGAALAREAARRGAGKVIVADRNADGAMRVADEIGGIAMPGDVRDPGYLAELVGGTEQHVGPIGLLCCNAGIASGFELQGSIASPSDGIWAAAWEINVLAHVRLARLALPHMLARGQGHFLQTLSAAGLLTQSGSAVYSTTKHAALGFAESLAISHGAAGIGVTVLCPQGVATPLLETIPEGPVQSDGVLTAEEVAIAGLDGVTANQFMVTPHAQVRRYFRRKAEDYEGWVRAMRRFV